jgi:hypothetical protein
MFEDSTGLDVRVSRCAPAKQVKAAFVVLGLRIGLTCKKTRHLERLSTSS